MSERILEKLKRGSSVRKSARGVNDGHVVSVRYIHGLSHRLSVVGACYGINVVFFLANKLSRICAAVHNGAEGVADQEQ